MTRALQDTLQKALGGQIVVKNIPGAAGTLGTAEAARAAPDGYTILISPIGPITLQPHRMKLDYSYDSFAPICKLVDSPVVLMGAPNSKYKTVADIVAAAKAAPGKIPYGSTGPGTTPHVAKLAFAKAAGIDIKHVPYKVTKAPNGDVRVLMSSTLDSYCSGLYRRPILDAMLVDMTETRGIDSTALGLLAKMAIQLRNRFNVIPTIVSTRPSGCPPIAATSLTFATTAAIPAPCGSASTNGGQIASPATSMDPS